MSLFRGGDEECDEDCDEDCDEECAEECDEESAEEGSNLDAEHRVRRRRRAAAAAAAVVAAPTVVPERREGERARADVVDAHAAERPAGLLARLAWSRDEAVCRIRISSLHNDEVTVICGRPPRQPQRP